MAPLWRAQEKLKKGMQNYFARCNPEARPFAQSLVAVGGLFFWLRLGGALTSFNVASQCAFGIAGAWQLVFAERAPSRSETEKPRTHVGALRYSVLCGIPILLVYLIVGYFALHVFKAGRNILVSWPLFKLGFSSQLTQVWSTLRDPDIGGHLFRPQLLAHVALTAGAAWVEELFWRGYVQPLWCAACVARNKPARLGILFQALAFGAAHVTTDLRISRLATALPGYWFGYAAMRTGGLAASTILHVGCNLAASLLHLCFVTRV